MLYKFESRIQWLTYSHTYHLLKGKKYILRNQMRSKEMLMNSTVGFTQKISFARKIVHQYKYTVFDNINLKD